VSHRLTKHADGSLWAMRRVGRHNAALRIDGRVFTAGAVVDGALFAADVCVCDDFEDAKARGLVAFDALDEAVCAMVAANVRNAGQTTPGHVVPDGGEP